MTGARALTVWEIPLGIDPTGLAACLRLLDLDEMTRLTRYRTADLQRRFAVAHAASRFILAGYLGADPAELSYEFGPWGKPELRGAPSLHHNLSHSGDLAVLAVSWDAPVGVDVESSERDLAAANMAGRFFPPAEAGVVAGCPPDRRTPQFVQFWTRKEAAGKAAGIPVGQAMKLPVQGDGAGFPVRLSPASGEQNLAWLKDVEVRAGYLAASAMMGAAPFDVAVDRWSPAVLSGQSPAIAGAAMSIGR